jgi:hypothetical protein
MGIGSDFKLSNTFASLVYAGPGNDLFFIALRCLAWRLLGLELPG